MPKKFMPDSLLAYGKVPHNAYIFCHFSEWPCWRLDMFYLAYTKRTYFLKLLCLKKAPIVGHPGMQSFRLLFV